MQIRTYRRSVVNQARNALYCSFVGATEYKKLHLIGSALIVINNNQTLSEQHQLTTLYKNNIGFQTSDCRSGTINAKLYADHKRLCGDAMNYWTRRMPNGYPRLCKYAAQLVIFAYEDLGRFDFLEEEYLNREKEKEKF